MSAAGAFEVGVALPTVGAARIDIAEAARLAEDLGVATVWVGDHVSFRLPVVDPVVALSIAAGATSQVGLGFGVLQAGLRHPLLLAKAVASLAAASGRRVIAGFGAGGDYEPEWQMLGLDPAERGPRLDEVLSMVPDLLSGRPVTHAGPHWNFESPPVEPSPPQRVPIWIGGRTRVALRRAARHDGWLGLFLRPDAFAHAVRELQELTSGSEPQCAIAIVAGVHGVDASARARCTNYLKHAYHLPTAVAEGWAIGGVQHLRDVVCSYREAGADHVLVQIVDDSLNAWPAAVDAMRVTSGNEAP